MLALFLVARVALRRSQESIATAHRLQQETEARRRVEEALLQSQPGHPAYTGVRLSSNSRS